MVMIPGKTAELWKARLKHHGWGLGQGLLIAAAFGYLYASVLPALVADWGNDPDYSHGFLVPVLSGYCLWERRHAFTQLPVQPSPVGLLLMLLGIALLLLGHEQEPHRAWLYWELREGMPSLPQAIPTQH